MPTIYGNLKNLEEGLTKTLETSKRTDFCIGYFNLRGWRKVSDQANNHDAIIATCLICTGYFPIQNFPKILPSTSSVVICPVIVPSS